jgi:hypothetical protein
VNFESFLFWYFWSSRIFNFPTSWS